MMTEKQFEFMLKCLMEQLKCEFRQQMYISGSIESEDTIEYVIKKTFSNVLELEKED